MIGGSLLPTLKFTPKRTDTTVVLSLPSSFEKELNRIPYSKGLSVLIKNKKIDYCLMFAVSKQKLKEMLDEVCPYLKSDCVLWIAFPKRTSKIITNLKRNDDWDFMQSMGYDKAVYIAMDGVWSAFRFVKVDSQQKKEWEQKRATVDISPYADAQQEDIKTLDPHLERAFEEHTIAYEFFKTLTFENKQDYLYWIHSVEKEIILKKRIQEAINKMNEGILNPFFSI